MKDRHEKKKLPSFIPLKKKKKKMFYEAKERRQIRFRRREVIQGASSILSATDPLIDASCDVEIPGVAKSMTESAISTAMDVLPPHANPSGSTFGGQVRETICTCIMSNKRVI